MTDQTAPHGNEDVPDYELDDDAANRQVDALVRGVATLVRGGEVERREAVEALSDGLRQLAVDDPDVADITVRDAIVRELDPVLVAAGWAKLEPFEF